jgi:hypothetical protein
MPQKSDFADLRIFTYQRSARDESDHFGPLFQLAAVASILLITSP